MSCHAQYTVTSSNMDISNACQIAFPQLLSPVKDFRLLQMIQTMQSHKVYFTRMHGEKVGGVSRFVQKMHTNIVWIL